MSGPLGRVLGAEVWTDVQANLGTRVAVIPFIQQIPIRATLQGVDECSIQIAQSNPAIRTHSTPEDSHNFAINKVIRLLYEAGTPPWKEYRISGRTRRYGADPSTWIIPARGIFHDLVLRAKVVRFGPSGLVETSFTSLGLTVTEQMQTHVIGNMKRVNVDFFAVGEVEDSVVRDVTYTEDSCESAVQKLCEIAGGLEVEVEGGAAQYLIHLRRQVGADLPIVTSYSRKNLSELTVEERSEDQANVIVPTGESTDAGPATAGNNFWEVYRATSSRPGFLNAFIRDPTGGDPPIVFDNQFGGTTGFLPPDRTTYVLVALEGTNAGVKYEITGASVAQQTLELRAESILFGSSRRFRIMRWNQTQFPERVPVSPIPVQAFEIEHRPSVLKYGRRVGSLARSDIPGTFNLMQNAYGRLWLGGDVLGNPLQWSKGSNSPFFAWTRKETDPTLWQHGGHSWYAAFPDNFSLLAAVSQAFPVDVQGGYLSYFASIITLAGRCRTWLRVFLTPPHTVTLGDPPVTRNFIEYPQDLPLLDPTITNITKVARSTQLNVFEEIGIAGVHDNTRFPSQQAVIFVQPDGIAGTIVCFDAVQLTNTPDQRPLIDGSGGTRLFQAANQSLIRHQSPAVAVSANILDLASADWTNFSEEALALGAKHRVVVPEAEEAFLARVLGWQREGTSPLQVQLELSDEQVDVVRLLARRSIGGRA